MSMSEVEAARTVRAALRLLIAAVPDTPERLHAILHEADGHVGRALHHLRRDAPPWEPEPTPDASLPWGQVVPGDSVLAPNGTWYRVDSVARIGEQVRALLILHEDAVGKRTVPTERSAGETVQVRRGDTGRAVDIFRAGGLDVETIGSEG